jgi:hypothetical protein
MAVDTAPIEARWTPPRCGSSLSGMAGITTCELETGHPGPHQGRLWGDAGFDLQTWKIGGHSGCTPPFFTPDPGEFEEEALNWLARLESGEIVRLEGPVPDGTYRCRRISCCQLQPVEKTLACPACSAPICSRCFRCGGPSPHVPSGELAYVADM